MTPIYTDARRPLRRVMGTFLVILTTDRSFVFFVFEEFSFFFRPQSIIHSIIHCVYTWSLLDQIVWQYKMKRVEANRQGRMIQLQ
jgi:hypothetical protein